MSPSRGKTSVTEGRGRGEAGCSGRAGRARFSHLRRAAPGCAAQLPYSHLPLHQSTPVVRSGTFSPLSAGGNQRRSRVRTHWKLCSSPGVPTGKERVPLADRKADHGYRGVTAGKCSVGVKNYPSEEYDVNEDMCVTGVAV